MTEVIIQFLYFVYFHSNIDNYNDQHHSSSAGDLVMVSVPQCVRLGFLTIIWKNNHSIHFKFGVGICWVSVQNYFSFGGLSDHYLKKYSHNPIQNCGVRLLHECSEIIRFWAMFAQFWPSSGKKITWKWVKMVVSDRYLKKYSHNPIQTWCVHLLGECSKLICFLAMLAKFCPLVATK